MGCTSQTTGNSDVKVNKSSDEKVTKDEQKPLVFIYHTHNEESFISETQVQEPNIAYHDSKNITLVGKRLSQELIERDISNIHDNTDIMGIMEKKGLSFNQSYRVSRDSLQEAIANNKNIKMVFDIHRDSQKRDNTTIKISGKDYARISFVISNSNESFEENKKFAESLHKKIEEKYPGLSRGITLQSSESKETYNQDIKGESVLLNIGGVENTLKEEYRTVDVLAEVIRETIEE
jgi:stage II sporulation protein P